MDTYECPKCHKVSHNPNDVANLYCGNCHLFLDDLRNEEVMDFKHLTDLRLTRKDCFTLALFTLVDSDNPGCRLVQGWVTSTVTGESIQHAWCEMPATGTYEDSSEGPIIVVIDYTQPDEHARIIPAELFYEKTGAHNVKRYTLAEAFSRASAVGHDGPWNDQ